MGQIGRVLARYLAEEYQVRLVLTGRTELPPRDAWLQWLSNHEIDDSISNRIRFIQTLEELDAQVLVMNADVADHAQMRQVISETYRHFGQLHGVIHAADIPGEQRSEDREDVARQYAEEETRRP